MKHWPIIKQVLMFLDFLYHALMKSYDEKDLEDKK